jgi:curved DNA-binding protein CbpA
MAADVTMHLNSRQRDEFLKALEEARRAAAAEANDPQPSRKPSPSAHASTELWQALDRMASRVRTYISANLLTRLYNEGMLRPPRGEVPRAPAPPPPKSDHDQVIDELHLTPGLTANDLKVIRRKFAMVHHPDRVPASAREQATRRMTIANCLIDEALRGIKVQAQ